MSGIGGGGFMLVYLAAEDRCNTVDCAMIAPAGLDPATFVIAGGTALDLFAWPAVVEDRNFWGPHSIAVPGLVAGMAAALKCLAAEGPRYLYEGEVAEAIAEDMAAAIRSTRRSSWSIRRSTPAPTR